MSYIENPKTKGSGIICCIPQTGVCPIKCDDCFFQSGRSYLEPLEENLPNMPLLETMGHRILRVNDGNDSNNNREAVMEAVKSFPLKFYNTSINKDLEKFDGPVVLTINPGKKTDESWYRVNPIPKNLMFIRVRVNSWNQENVVDPAIEYYSSVKVPVVLTFMRYYTETIPETYAGFYEWKKRILNSYWVLKPIFERSIEQRYSENPWVYTCGWKGTFTCDRCGHCLREFFAAMERMYPQE